MKTMISSFGNFALSRDQMKKVTGGSIQCTVTCNFQGGASSSYTGTCGLSTISACLNSKPAGDTPENCVHSSCRNHEA